MHKEAVVPTSCDTTLSCSFRKVHCWCKDWKARTWCRCSVGALNCTSCHHRVVSEHRSMWCFLANLWPASALRANQAFWAKVLCQARSKSCQQRSRNFP
jgi:hypothetical protein